MVGAAVAAGAGVRLKKPKILLMILGCAAATGASATGFAFGSIMGAGCDGRVDFTTAVGFGAGASVCAEGSSESGFSGAVII